MQFPFIQHYSVTKKALNVSERSDFKEPLWSFLPGIQLAN